MAQALITGLRDKHSISVFDPSSESSAAAGKLGAKVLRSNAEVARASQILFIATKPQYVSAVLREVKSSIAPDTIVVSIAAGISTAAMEAELEKGAKVVRCMPNTPALVKSMAAGYVGGKNATASDLKTVGALLSSLGSSVQVANEDLMHAVTGLSGSGPAYVFMFIEALADGGVKAGLPRDAALLLAASTVRGAADMLMQSGKHPGVLKDSVCSPGGTTIEAVAALEEGGLRSAVIKAVVAAADRSRVLGGPKL